MRKRAERTLKELYNLTQRISEPEITPVLKGSCRIQGPVDDLDLHLQWTDSKFMFPKDCTSMRIESGACTVCSAPCSLCTHYNSESGFSCNLSVRTEADSSSVSVVDSMPMYKSRICDELQPAASETSNLLSTSSSHDSYSENAESRTSLRASVAYDASDDVDMPQVFCSSEIVEGEQSFKINPDPDQFSLHSDTHLGHRFPSGKGDGQDGLECHRDNNLCTSGARDPNIVVSDCIADIEKKGGECSNMLISGFVEVNNNVVPAEAGDDNQSHEIGESHCISRRSNATVDSSVLHNTYNSTSVNNVSYVKSQLPSRINDVSPKTCPLSSLSQDGNPKFMGESMVIEGTFNLQPQAEFNRCAGVDNVDSSLASLITGNSPENKSSTITNHEASIESRTKCSSGTSNINGLCQDTKLGTDCKKASENCSEDRHVNDLLERDGSVLDAAKGEDQHVLPQASTVAENYESDVTLDDVKVCDICGDAGREDLLAICSWCSDGAEHTYCMREKLDKVPEGEWLCEECKIKEMENQNVNECEAVYGRSKSTRLNDINQNSMNTLIQKQAHKLDARPTDLDARSSAEGLPGPHISIRRQVDHLEEGKASELNGASVEIASPKKKPVLSCQISLRNQDMGKEVKKASMETSSEVQPAKVSGAFTRSKSYLSSCSFKGLPPLYSPRGKFSRSASFSNSSLNPKVKTLIEIPPPKQKITRKPADNGLRNEGLLKLSTKTTFKNTTLGSSNTELASKNPSLQPSRIEDLRALKEVKEQNTVEKKNFSAKGNSVVRPSAAVTSNYPLKVDAKSAQSDGKISSVSEANVRSFSKGLDADDLGSNEGKKHISYSSKSIESSNGNYYTDNPEGSKVAKEGIRRSISAVDGSYRKVEIVSPCAAVLPLESCHKDNRTRDSTTFIGSRLSAMGGNRMSYSQRGNETERVTQLCSTDKLGGSSRKTSVEQNLREVEKKGNKWREVVDTAMLRSGVLKSEKLDTLEELPAASADMIREAASKYPPSDFNQRSLVVESIIGKVSSKDSADVPTKTLVARGSGQPAVLPVEASYKAEGTRGIPTAIELSAKSFAETSRGEAPLLANPLCGSAVPKLDCIWQGSFNVIGTGSPPKMFFGIQAHLSTCASHRVFQLATKVPDKVQLEEVSLISSWPLQLLRTGPKEENIALFFFANDTESYEKSYKKLMDKMHRNDLALRGNIDGTELLIFTSNKLPMNSQRWNRMHYLWGLFRGKRRYCLRVMGDQKKSLLCNQDFSSPPIADVTNAQKLETNLKPKKLSDSTSSKGMPGVSTNGVDLRTISSDIEDKAHKTLEAYPVLNLLNQGPADPKVHQEQPSFHVRSALRVIMDTPYSRLKMPTTKSCSEEKNDSDCQEKIVTDCTNRKADDSPVLTYEIGVESSLRRESSVLSVSSNCNKGSDCINIEGKYGEKKTSPPVVAIINDYQRGNVLGADLLSGESTANRKRGRSCSIERLAQPSGEISKNTIETVLLRDRPSWLPVEDEREQKKAYYASVSNIIDDNICARLSSKIHPLHSSILRQQQQEESICRETLTPQSSRTAERCFFPIDLSPAQNTVSTILRIPSSDEETHESSTPDLELALGGKSKSTQHFAFPSLFHSVKGGKQHMQHGPSGDGDDVPASLSLSL